MYLSRCLFNNDGMFHLPHVSEKEINPLLFGVVKYIIIFYVHKKKLHILPACQSSHNGGLVGIFKVPAHRQTARQARDMQRVICQLLF